MGNPGKGRPGRPKKEVALVRVAEAIAPLAEKMLDPAEIHPQARQVGGEHTLVVKSGKAEQVVWLKMCAWPNEHIARKVGLHHDAVNRYVNSPHFATLYEQKKGEFLGRVLEEMQGRLLEVGLEALQTRVELMRKAKSLWLRDKIAKDMLELAIEIGKARGPSGEVAEKLVAVIERIKKRKMADGSTEIEKIRVTGGAGEAAEALAAEVGESLGAPRVPDEGGSGEPAGPDGGSSEARGEDGSPEGAPGS